MTARRLLLSCLLLLCLAWGGTCSAADPLEAKEQEIRQLLQNSIRQEEITTILNLNSSEAQKQLLIVTAELQASKKEFAELKKAHQQLTDSYSKMMALSQRQDESLRKINESFEIYSKETKAKIKSLKRQNDLLKLITAYAVYKVAT